MATIDPSKVPRLFAAGQIASLGADFGWRLMRKPDPRYIYGPFTTPAGTNAPPQWHYGVLAPKNVFGVISGVSLPLPAGADVVPAGWTADPLPVTYSFRTGSGMFDPNNGPTISRYTAPAWFPPGIGKYTGPGGTPNAGPITFSLDLPTSTQINLNPYPSGSRPIMVWKVLMPWGSYAYFVPPLWSLNEGDQGVLPATAKRFGGIELGIPRLLNRVNTDSRGYLFAYNPEDLIPAGLPSGAYQPGPNVGAQNVRAVEMGVAFIGGLVVGGAIVGPALAAGGAGVGGSTGVAAGAVSGEIGAGVGGAAASVVDVSATTALDVGASIGSNIATEAAIGAGEAAAVGTTTAAETVSVGGTIGETAALAVPESASLTSDAATAGLTDVGGSAAGSATGSGGGFFSNVAQQVGAQLEKTVIGLAVSKGLATILPGNKPKPVQHGVSLLEFSGAGGGAPQQAAGFNIFPWLMLLLIALILLLVGRRMQS